MARKLAQGKMRVLDVAREVSRRAGLTRRESLEIVHAVFDRIRGTIQKKRNVSISGFGTFVVKRHRARKGRNLRTGEILPIPERSVVFFKPSKILKEFVNR